VRDREALEGIPPQLWQRVAQARHRFLMLDYDGTLAPIVVSRGEARMPPLSLERLQAIVASTHTRVAIISGRPVSEVEQLLGPLPVTIAGEHGWEQRSPDGMTVLFPLAPAAVQALEDAARAALGSGWGDFLERKRAAAVLHTRSLPPERARELEERCLSLWLPLSAGGMVSLERGHGGVEMRANGHDKGTVVRSLWSEAPVGSLAVFVGDDVSDERAFSAVREWGFGIKVGALAAPTHADGHLPSNQAVVRFLDEWMRIAEGAEDDEP
jgi:trehalose-phosphatase